MNAGLRSLPADALRLLDYIREIADAIAERAAPLGPTEAQALIELELARLAAEMKTGEGRSAPSVAAAIDACLRERIASRLSEQRL